VNWLRLVAWAIALAAVIDPAVERDELPPAVVGVRVATAWPSPDAESFVERITERLGARAVVAREAPLADGRWCVGADVCVAVSDGTAAIGAQPAAPVHVVQVVPPLVAQVVAAQATPGHLAEMSEVRTAVAGGRPGDVVELIVEDDGVEVGRLSHTRTGRAIDAGVVVPWWPRRDGVRLVTVRVEDAGNSGPGPAAVVADTASAPLDVLLWEGRPSWTGTFLRRALQDDPRLAVRAASLIAPTRLVRRGLPGPAGDDDLRRSRAVVVTGAAALDTRAIARLDRYARTGGAVVVALDEPPSGPLLALMPGPTAGQRRAVDPVTVGDRLQSAELVSFTGGPGDAVLAAWDGAPTGQEAVIVQRPAGRGTIVVSGALDAWRWRGDAGGFDRFWQETVVRAARLSAPPLAAAWAADLANRQLRLSSREGVVAGTWPAVTLQRTCGGSPAAMPAIAAAEPGNWFVDPRGLVAGCTVAATLGGDRIETPWPGAPTLPLVAPTPGALATLAAASGGSILDAADSIDAIAALVDAADRGPAVPRQWHPMRAWWWFVPFVAALGLEWWRRRRDAVRP
jgi:hypothetical protein